MSSAKTLAFVTMALVTCFIASEPSHADDVNVIVDKSSVGDTGVIWDLKLQNKEDKLIINSAVINRGNCKIGFGGVAHRFPFSMDFGELVDFRMAACEPIELVLNTSKGNTTLTFGDHDFNYNVGADIWNEYMSGMIFKRLKITALSDITIHSLEINRGKCGKLRNSSFFVG